MTAQKKTKKTKAKAKTTTRGRPRAEAKRKTKGRIVPPRPRRAEAPAINPSASAPDIKAILANSTRAAVRKAALKAWHDPEAAVKAVERLSVAARSLHQHAKTEEGKAQIANLIAGIALMLRPHGEAAFVKALDNLLGPEGDKR